jgi:transcriptional regulator with XRE-family HTH domain
LHEAARAIDMDTSRLSSELVRHLRGPRLSQEALSRRLGYRSNVLYLWEQGRRFPGARAFFSLAHARKVPLLARVREFLGDASRNTARAGARGEVLAVAPLLRGLAAGRNATELAALSGYDRNTIARWLAGKSEPRLPELLKFIGITTLRLTDFVALFVDPRQLESTRQIYEQLEAQRRLAYTSPWSHAVLRALELDGYGKRRHDTGWLAQCLGVSRDVVEQNLTALAQAGQARNEGGRYVLNQVLSVDTHADFEHNLRLKHFWAQVAAERLPKHARERRSLFSYNLFPISRADLERLRELHLEYFQRVRQLVEAARGADHVVLLNLQLVALDEG